MQNILGKVVLHTVLCQKENKQYIFQYGGGGHLGFMCEQYLKVRKNVRNYFLIQNSQRESDENWKTYNYFPRRQWRPSLIYARTRT